MKITPSKAEFIELAKTGNLIPVFADFMADFETPVSVYSKLNKKKTAFLFESVEGGENISRYSFVGCNPQKIFAAFADKTLIVDAQGKVEEIPTPADPLKLIEEEMAQYQPVEVPDMPPFHGGAVGFLSYEYVHRVETTVEIAAADELNMPILYYAITDSVVAFDHAKQMLRVCANAKLPEDVSPEAAYDAAVKTLEELVATLQTSSSEQNTAKTLAAVPNPASTEIEVPPGNFTQAEFEAAVEKTKEYIHSGDVIQVVGSQRFKREYTKTPLELYRVLRLINPSPYMFILETDDFSLVGASPEVHVRNTNAHVEIRPIAGTRPRGKTPDADHELELDLLADAKERAEHLMLVDLARNDIGRVCKTGSVEVKDYAIIERYSHVMHIVSQVEGELDSSNNAYDLMRATFPAGTVSGAPKVRAMQIISELEKTQRGPYAGALGYFSYNGNLDCCIAIRTALIKDNTIYVQSGAGLVADSVPLNEYEETINKAKGMLKAIHLSDQI